MWKVQDFGEHVECQKCARIFEPTVLSIRVPQVNGRPLMAVKTELEGGMPLHMVEKRLIAAGVEAEAAHMAVKVEAGSEVKTCSGCSFQYHPKVTACSNCGAALGAL